MLPGLAVIVATSEAEAQDKAAYYRELMHTEPIQRYLLSEPSGYNFAGVDLDGPFPDIDASDPAINGALIERWKALAKADRLTVRQVADKAIPRGALVGSPAQVADHFQRWQEEEACDGFLLTPTLFPGDLEDFVNLVVPELQSRRLFRTKYTGGTLRKNLGLERPLSPWLANAEIR